MKNLLPHILALTLVLMIVGLSPIRVCAQEPEENDPAKAAALVRDAIKARGGDVYLNVKTLVGRGNYTPYDKGVSGDPMSFVDYVVYPGRDRTEFGKGDSKQIQSNSERANWIYDAGQKMIRDQKEDQVRQVQQDMRYDVDNLLRAAAKGEGVKLVYAGRREAWRNTFSEAVRVEFNDGGSGTLHFDPRSKLPLMVEYKQVTAEGTGSRETRFFRWVEYGGIQFPTVQDSYRDGKQTGHVSYDSVNVNVNIADKLFDKPSSVKDVK
jgi:hypothetical protein